jgi:hypothetical protein
MTIPAPVALIATQVSTAMLHLRVMSHQGHRPCGAQLNVAEAAPGDSDYNGGRWRVQILSFNTDYATTKAAHDLDGSDVIDSDAEVLSAFRDEGRPEQRSPAADRHLCAR